MQDDRPAPTIRLATTTTELGAQPLADFEVAGRQYVLLAFEF